jgi:AIR synthase-related protein
MTGVTSLQDLAARVMSGRGMAHKTDIADVVASLGLADGAIRVGDDCAAIPDGDGYLLFAIEGFVNDFVESDPRFAGFCGVMVNVSDIAAMGGRPLAVVDAIWSRGGAQADPILAGLREAASVYGTPIVGGHTNNRSAQGQLAVAILGRAKKLITSFDVMDGDSLIAAIDLRGRFRAPDLYWDAATGAPQSRLRSDLALLPDLAESGLVTGGKDISMAGLVGTAMMLLESSKCGGWIDVDAVPCPAGVPLDRFLMAFPSFGFILSAAPTDVGAVIARFAARDIACAAIGRADGSGKVRLVRDQEEIEIWDFATSFIGCAGDGTLPARVDKMLFEGGR